MAILSCWNIASPFPKLFCAQLHVADCTEKIWTDLALSLFCCRQCIWIPCLVLLVCAFLWWAPFKVRASSRSTCGASSVPSGYLCSARGTSQITGAAFGGQHVLVLRRLWASIQSPECGSQVALTSLLPPVPLSYAACPCLLLACQAGLTQCTSGGNMLFSRVRCPVGPHRQCLREGCISTSVYGLGNQGTKKWTRIRSNRSTGGEPGFESYPRQRSPRNILLFYCASCNLNAILFTFCSFFVNISCNYFIGLSTLWNRNE